MSAPSTVAGGGAELWHIPVRFFKMGASLAILLAGTYGIFSERQFIASSDAVVSAYVASIRTPIDGTVSGMLAIPGTQVREGAVLGRVDNPRADEQRLENLRDIEQEARNGTEAVSSELAALRGQRRELLTRTQAHTEAVSARLHLQTMEAARLLAAKRAALDEASIELGRGRQLHDSGIISNADIDRLQTQYDVAVHEEAAQRANLSAIREEAESATKGILIEPGVSDVAYSRQRADEVSLHLVETGHALVTLQSQARQAEADVESEAKRSDLMRHADLVSPISGVLWKIEAINGERVGVGDSVAQIVDCNQQFVLAEVPQDRVPDIAFGGLARFRLSGESLERIGIVVSVIEDPKKEGDRKLAALPVPGLGESLATVRLGFEPGAGQDLCSIGRTVRVLLPTTGRSLIARWYRRYF